MMKMNSIRRMLSLIACIVLIAAMALLTIGCSDTDSTKESEKTEIQAQPIGEGSTVFTFIAVDLDGNQTAYEVHTDETTVGAALLDLELISGDIGEYGLYVKTVNGITLDWDTHGKYWALYIDGEYSLNGVDLVDIVPGTTYTFQPA